MEEDDNKNQKFKNKGRNKNLPVFPMHGPGHGMNSCTVIHAQSKDIKSAWTTSRVCREGHIQFQGDTKHPYEGK